MAAETEQNADRALVDLAAGVRSQHWAGDRKAYELARWVLDFAPVLDMVQAWAETVTTDGDDEDREQAGTELLRTWQTYLHNREKHTHD